MRGFKATDHSRSGCLRGNVDERAFRRVAGSRVGAMFSAFSGSRGRILAKNEKPRRNDAAPGLA